MSRSARQNININLFPSPHDLANQIQHLELMASSASRNDNFNSLQQFIDNENDYSSSNHRIDGIINVNQSSGVVIGPNIQFQAPVTFNQYINATVERDGNGF